MTKSKKIAATVAAMALTAAVAVGGTMAYLQSVTETKTNTFTSSKNITTELTETEWNKDSGNDYFPGKEINKNPVMKNESSNEAIYTAVKLDYLDNDGAMVDYGTFQQYASVEDFNTTDWTKIATTTDGSEIWMYKTTVAPAASTNAIFNKVQVNFGIKEAWTKEAKTEKLYQVAADGTKTLVNTTTTNYDPTVTYTDENGNTVAGVGQLPTFEIKVTGFAVQADNTDAAAATTELKDLVSSKTGVSFK